MSQKQKKPGAGFGGSGDDAPQGQEQYNPSAAQKMVQSLDDSLGKVRLTYGAHDLQVEIEGLSVAEAQLAYKDILTVEDDAEAYLNGKLVTNKTTQRLQKGDRLEFMKEAGQKGMPSKKQVSDRAALRNVPELRRIDEEDEEEMGHEVKATVKDVDVERASVKQITIPKGMHLREAAAWLMRKDMEEDKEVEVYHEIDCFPLDGCVAFRDALVDLYGYVQNADTPGWFKNNPPVMIGVPISATETRQVPWGRVEVPGIEGFLSTGIKVTKAGPRFLVTGTTKQRHLLEVNEIVDTVKNRLKSNSIYKGKAVRLDLSWTRSGDPARNFDPTGHAPKFSIPVDSVREGELIFSKEVERDINLGLFTPIEYPDACRKAGIPLKRGVLLAGDYGTGKTLTAYVTALKAVRSGFTFIYLSSVVDLAMAFQFAKQYAPAVIFSEDVDRVLGGQDRTEAIDAVLNSFDGVDSKHEEIITVLTTNHLDRLTKAVLRPGRCDTLVQVTRPDAEAASKLVKLYGRNLLAPETDYDAIGASLADHLPAEIREAVERAKLAAIARLENVADGIEGKVTEKDVIAATEAMAAQHDMLIPKEQDTRTPIEKAADQLGFHLRNGIGDRDEANAAAAVRLLQRLGMKAEDLNEAYLDESDDEPVVHAIPTAAGNNGEE